MMLGQYFEIWVLVFGLKGLFKGSSVSNLIESQEKNHISDVNLYYKEFI